MQPQRGLLVALTVVRVGIGASTPCASASDALQALGGAVTGSGLVYVTHDG
jgi:hypothetical protein